LDGEGGGVGATKEPDKGHDAERLEAETKGMEAEIPQESGTIANHRLPGNVTRMVIAEEGEGGCFKVPQNFRGSKAGRSHEPEARERITVEDRNATTDAQMSGPPATKDTTEASAEGGPIHPR
jgi:uncharacterized membrane protein